MSDQIKNNSLGFLFASDKAKGTWSDWREGTQHLHLSAIYNYAGTLLPRQFAHTPVNPVQGNGSKEEDVFCVGVLNYIHLKGPFISTGINACCI